MQSQFVSVNQSTGEKEGKGEGEGAEDMRETIAVLYGRKIIYYVW